MSLRVMIVQIQIESVSIKKKLPGARKTALPNLIAPQLATLVKEPPSGNHWLHELKFDGYRMLCRVDRGKVRFWSRNGKDWTDKFLKCC
jgi:bifunctional non-homologous end joining protein LigD